MKKTPATESRPTGWRRPGFHSKVNRMAKETGIPTMLHSCGKEKILVKWRV